MIREMNSESTEGAAALERQTPNVSLKELLKDEIKGKRGVEKETSVFFLIGSHTASYIDHFEGRIKSKPPNVIVVEEENGADFRDMLEGRMSIKDYIKSRTYISDEFRERRYEFYELLRELNKKGVIVESLGHRTPIEMSIGRVITAHQTDTYAERLNFEKAVKAAINSAKVEASSKGAEEKRAGIIAEKIKDGKWSGTVFIEVGPVHTRVKNLLVEKLREDKIEGVNVASEYPAREKAIETFGDHLYHVYTPFDELERLYLYGRDKKMIKEELRKEESLLGARRVILERIKNIPEDTEFMVEKAINEATKAVNQLSYEGCKQIFKKIKDMDEKTAFEFVEKYAREKNRMKQS